MLRNVLKFDIERRQLATHELDCLEVSRQFSYHCFEASRYVESLLLRLPQNPFLLGPGTVAEYKILSGHQRIKIIQNFMDDKIVLQDTIWLKALNGLSWSRLDPIDRNYFSLLSHDCFVTSAQGIDLSRLITGLNLKFTNLEYE